jgi:hypothetical protein
MTVNRSYSLTPFKWFYGFGAVLFAPGIAAALTVEWPQYPRVLWAFRRQRSGSFVITEDGFELSDRDAPREAIPWERVGRLRTNNYGELLLCSPNDDVLGRVPLRLLPVSLLVAESMFAHSQKTRIGACSPL